MSGLYRSRTDTPLRAMDFESIASANSAKRPFLAGSRVGQSYRMTRITQPIPLLPADALHQRRLSVRPPAARSCTSSVQKSAGCRSRPKNSLQKCTLRKQAATGFLRTLWLTPCDVQRVAAWISRMQAIPAVREIALQVHSRAKGIPRLPGR